METRANDESTKKLASIVLAGITLVVLLLVVTLIFGAVKSANTSLNGVVTAGITIINESGFANSSGYTLINSTNYHFSSPVITALWNRTSGIAVPLGNATVSALGVVKNATAMAWNNLSISYTFVYDITNITGVNNGIDSIQDGVIGMIDNFFTLMPTVGTILAVVVLLACLVILVIYVMKMRNKGEDGVIAG